MPVVPSLAVIEMVVLGELWFTDVNGARLLRQWHLAALIASLGWVAMYELITMLVPSAWRLTTA
jgi:hypothetical protein